MKYFLFLLPTLATLASAFYYTDFARRRGIVAHINSRTLHEKIVPRGGGITFALVFSVACSAGWMAGLIETVQWLAFGIGGAAAALVGFFDDVTEVAASRKLLMQAGLSIWFFLIFFIPVHYGQLEGLTLTARAALTLFLLFVPVWLINMYNFIDGIDGMAVSGAIFICSAALLVLFATRSDSSLRLLFALLGASSLGFLFINLPPARIFMGDAGSIFLGYTVAALALASIFGGELSVFTWLCILSYYLGDTTTTTLSRMYLVKRWYGEHRSHAYQNLARIRKSHGVVTYGVALYNAAWALPLALWSALRPQSAPVAAVLALLPVVLWTLRFGPRLSSD